MDNIVNEDDGRVFGPSSLVERRKLNWSAIFAGVVAALGLQVLLLFFGGALGLSMLNLYDMAAADKADYILPLVWLAITAIGSYFFGAWISGHWANLYEAEDAYIHGALTWALGTLFMALGLGGFLGVSANATQATAMTARDMGAGVRADNGRMSHPEGLAYSNLDDQRFTSFVLNRAKNWAATNPAKHDEEPVNVTSEQKAKAKANDVDPDKIVGNDELVAFVAVNGNMSEDQTEKFLENDKEAIAKAHLDSQKRWQQQHARELAQAEKIRKAASTIAWTMTGLSLLALAAAIGGSYLGWYQRYADEDDMEDLDDDEDIRQSSI